jgi:tRNA nucleotidyltransferase (CCA-adding enzyme)
MAKNGAKIPRNVRQIGKVFDRAGHEIRIVGGWVRDTLRREKPKDLDLATPATPEQMMEVCSSNGLRYVETGLQHGTIGIVHRGVMYEITTLRVDLTCKIVGNR